MDTLKALKHRYQAYCILVMLLVLMSVVTGVCNQLSVYEVAFFICFQLFCVLLPGTAAMILMPVKNLRGIEKLAFLYTIGYILTILIYAVVMATVGREYVRISFLLTAVLSGAVIFFQRKKAISLVAGLTEDQKCAWGGVKYGFGQSWRYF